MQHSRARLFGFATAAILSLLLGGCGGSSSDNVAESVPGGYVLFDIATDNIPYPNDILIDPSTGRVHFDTSPEESDYPVKAALNTLDGFSTTSPITVGVSADVDTATLPAHVVVIDALQGKPLAYGTDYALSYAEGKIAISPLKPLQGAGHYIVAVTKGLLATGGKAFAPDYVTSLILSDKPLLDAAGNPTIILDTDPAKNLETVTKLEAIRQHTQQVIALSGLPAETLLDIWSFTTQTIGKVAEAFATKNTSDAYLGFVDTGYTSKEILLDFYKDDAAKSAQINASMSGNAEIYVGVLGNLPYYLGVADNNHSTVPLTYSFQFSGTDGLPDETARLKIPVLASVPLADYCQPYKDHWPVVIFQHGVTRNRLDLLAVSEALANVCYAAVAIDLPLHGITDTNNTLYKLGVQMGAQERTFDLDLVTQVGEQVVAYAPDGKIDTSGVHYMNLQNLLTARDNIRQSTSDYIALYNALVQAQADTNGLGFDSSKISYVGHSLGAMAPFGYFATKDISGQSVKAAVLADEGGGIAELLMHSETFGDTIRQALESIAGIKPYTPAYYQFINATQTILDDADPVNYAAKAASLQTMLSFEVANDDVIPNFVATAPLAGQEPLLGLMNAQDILSYPRNPDSSTVVMQSKNTVTRFERGNHRSILDPQYDPDVTVEMQTEMATFIYSEGQAADVNVSRILN